MSSNSRTTKRGGSNRKSSREQRVNDCVLSPAQVADTQCTPQTENSILDLKEFLLVSESSNKTSKESNSQEYDSGKPSSSNGERDYSVEPFAKNLHHCKAVEQTILRLQLDLTSIDRKLNEPVDSISSLHSSVHVFRFDCLYVLERISVFQMDLLNEDFKLYSSSEPQLKRLENKCYDLIKVCDAAASKRIVDDIEDHGLTSKVSAEPFQNQNKSQLFIPPLVAPPSIPAPSLHPTPSPV